MTSILFVCTANQCRSVLAEHLMRARIASAGLDWTVSSAGTHARAGAEAQPLTVAALAEHDFEVDPGWQSRAITAAIVDDADLILTATHMHVRDVLQRNPRSSRRTFALLQFARLLAAGSEAGSEGAAHPSELTMMAARGRLRVQPRAAELDDIADPVGGTIEAYRQCAQVIGTALDAMADRLSGSDMSRSPSAF